MTSEPSRWARAAVEHVRGVATGPPLEGSLRVTLNFHPDRVSHGRSVLEHLALDGVYRSQFETATSNGGLTACPGGDRWRWEQRIFGAAYDDAPDSERPRYGAIDQRRGPLGGAPRFGSAYLRLREHVLDRCTFCFPDSVFEPAHFATAERFDIFGLAGSARLDHLDDYVEAHVHGVVRLDRDVEALVLDPCYRDSATATVAARLGVPLEWHEGRVLRVDELDRHPDYRGPAIVEVGRRVAERGRLDAGIIGRAVAQGVEDPQDLKKVWHHVARFGSAPES